MTIEDRTTEGDADASPRRAVSDGSAPSGMQSLLRGLSVLESVAQHQPVGVAKLARVLGLPKSTVQRTLWALGDAGWIETGPDQQAQWSLTTRVWDLAQYAGWESDLRRAAQPHLHRLGEATQETVHFSVPDGTSHLVLLERVDSPQPVQTYLTAGAVMPLHACSSGKAILATWPEDKLAQALAGDLDRPTPRSVVDPGKIRAELDDIRARGFAINFGESRPGVAAVGAAIRNPLGEAVAAVAVSMPDSRFDPRLVDHWGELVTQTARAIEKSWRRAP